MEWPIAWQAARQGAIIIRDPAVVCVDLGQMKHAQQQRLPQKGLMTRRQVDTGVYKRWGVGGCTDRQTQMGKEG